MARRHDGLLPLTHDHHHALRHARLLREAADDAAPQRALAVRAFIDFFDHESILHFREEEEQIFPLVADHPEAPWGSIGRVLREHVMLHCGVRRLASSLGREDLSAATMREIADLLKSHVRFEEDELFPEIERLAGDDLSKVQLHERERTPRADSSS